jgi:hypothetical protein
MSPTTTLAPPAPSGPAFHRDPPKVPGHRRVICEQLIKRPPALARGGVHPEDKALDEQVRRSAGVHCPPASSG